MSVAQRTQKLITREIGVSAGKRDDPIQKAVSALEERVNVIGQAVFGSEEFGKVMNGAIRAQSQVQRSFSNRMAKNLHFYNIPTQDDIILLAEQCGRIEERLVSVESMLHKLVEQKTQPAKIGPARTRKPKSATSASSATKTTPAKKTSTRASSNKAKKTT